MVTKYKKFVATAATATLVASAIAPLASADELVFSDMAGYDADTIALVEDLAADGIIVGSNGKFNPQGDVSRKHAVLIIGRYLESLGLEASEGVKQFDDVDGKDQEFARLALLVRDLGIFNGNDLGQLNPSGKFTRQNMALVIDRVFELTTGKTLKEIADEQGKKGNVADINKVKDEAKEAVLAANALGLSKVATFNPEGTAKRVHFAQFFYVAAPIIEENLEVAVSVKAEIDAVVAATTALPAANTVTAANATAAQTAVNTLNTAIKALEDAVKKAGQELSADQAAAATKAVTDGKAAAAAVQAAIEATKTLSVSSVSAISANEFRVVFNNEVNKDSAENTANYEIFIGTNTSKEATSNYRAVLQSDKKTVILQKVDNPASPTTTSPFVVNGQTYKVNVKESVLDSNYRPVTAYTGTAAIFNDNVAPTLVSATLSGAQLTLEFNERVTAIPSLKVDGKTVSSPNISLTAGSTKVTYTLTDADHIAYGTHNIQLYSVADTAGNTAVLLNGTYEATANNVKPTVSKVEALSTNKFRVTFEAPITTLAASNFEIRKGSYTFADTAISTSEVAGTSSKVWDVTITDAVGTVNPLYGTNENAVNLAVTVKNYKGTNNVFGDVYNTNVTLTKDTVKPVVQNAAINQANANTRTLSIIFNEELDNATVGSFLNGVNASKLAVTHDGVQVAIASATVNATDKKKLDIVLTPALQDGTYTVTIGADAVRDLAENTNAATTTTVATKVANGESIFAPLGAAITNTVDQVSGQNRITITYPEKMTNSAVDLGNYKLDGVPLNSPLFAGATAGFTTSGKNIVQIVLPKGQIATNTTAAVLEYSNNIIADSGRVVIKTDKTVYSSLIASGWADDVAPELKSAAFVKSTSGDTSVNTIKLTFSEAVTVSDVQDFIVTIGGAKVGVNTNVVQNTNKEIVLRLNESVNVNQTGNTVAITLDKTHNTNGVINIADATGNLATVKSVALVDSIVDSSLVSAANPGAPAAPASTFAFNGGNAGKLMGTTTAHEFSLDGGANWISVTTPDQALTAPQLASVNATSDILVRVKASGLTPAGNIQTHNVVAGPIAPVGLTATTDASGTVTGAANSTTYEYSTDGITWTTITSSAAGVLTLPGVGTYKFRVPATGLALPGAATADITLS